MTFVNDEAADLQTFTVPVTIVITGSRCNGDSTLCCHSDKSFCFHLIVLLPPANKVWGKVMFLHLCVILLTGEGRLAPACFCLWMGDGGRLCIQGNRADPPPHWILRDMVNERAVRIQVECILVEH